MAKQSKFDVFDTKSEVTHTDSNSPKEVAIRLLMDTRFKIVGIPSGREYIFNGAGAEVKVALEDVEFFLAQHRDAACCGGISNAAIFQKV